jgi:glycosyltransferase domain-containing protein
VPPSSADAVTLIVPTVHHRAALFARTLRYLAESGFKGPIVVSDHSPTEHADAIAQVVAGAPGLDLRVVAHAPDLHFLDRLVDCARRAGTPFVHLHADDDFVILPTLDVLLERLRERPDASAALGINVHVAFAERDVTVAPKFANEATDAFARLVAGLESYSSVLYALRRRDEFIASMSFARARCPDVQFWQYLETCMATLAGPILTVDDLHYVRAVHAAKWSATLVRERSADHFPYLILSPEFAPRVAAFQAALVEACLDRRIAVDRAALDAGLIHLLYRGLAVMGLPEKRFAASDTTREAAARLEARFRDPSDPATRQLRRIFEM